MSLVNYTYGLLTMKAQLMQVVALSDNKVVLFVDTTNFHPQDYQWPDQPSDKGHIEIDGRCFAVEKCCVAAHNSDPQIYLDKDIPVKRGEAGWEFSVAHVVHDEEQFFVNHTPQEILLQIDGDYRMALSTAHSVCHLMALALNKITRSFWKSLPDRLDSLGNPDLDSLAISRSQLQPYQSTDIYRLGKSIRKKGFNTEEFFKNLPACQQALQEQVNAWIMTSLSIQNFPYPVIITEKRFWECDLPDGKAHIPCGGTHVENLVGVVAIEMTLPAEGELMISTRVKSEGVRLA